MLRRIAPGVLWVGALLAAVLSLQRMFASDHADGSLEQMVLSPTPLVVTALAKTLAHWLLAGLPLVLVAPVLGLQFDLDARALGLLTLSAAGHAGAEPGRVGRGGADPGRARRRGAARRC